MCSHSMFNVKTDYSVLRTSLLALLAAALRAFVAVARRRHGGPKHDDDAAAKLSAVAASLGNCSLPELKRGAHSLLAKAAKIFDELSQGL